MNSCLIQICYFDHGLTQLSRYNFTSLAEFTTTKIGNVTRIVISTFNNFGCTDISRLQHRRFDLWIVNWSQVELDVA